MNREIFNEIMEKSTHKFKSEHLDILYSLVKERESRIFRRAILEINKMEKFPKREELFKLISDFEEDDVFENKYYIVKRGKTVWDTSFTIKKSFFVNKKIQEIERAT